MKKILLACVAVLSLPLVYARAEPVPTSINIVKVAVTPNGAAFDVTVTGMISLGSAAKKLKSWTFYFTDSKMKTVPAQIVPFTGPTPGQTIEWKITPLGNPVTLEKGWNVHVKIEDDQGTTKSDDAVFTVPVSCSPSEAR